MSEQTAHPSPETLAAFIDGRYADGTELHRIVIAHMANCGDCMSIVGGAAEVVEPAPETDDEENACPCTHFAPAASVDGEWDFFDFIADPKNEGFVKMFAQLLHGFNAESWRKRRVR